MIVLHRPSIDRRAAVNKGVRNRIRQLQRETVPDTFIVLTPLLSVVGKDEDRVQLPDGPVQLGLHADGGD